MKRSLTTTSVCAGRVRLHLSHQIGIIVIASRVGIGTSSDSRIGQVSSGTRLRSSTKSVSGGSGISIGLGESVVLGSIRRSTANISTDTSAITSCGSSTILRTREIIGSDSIRSESRVVSSSSGCSSISGFGTSVIIGGSSLGRQRSHVGSVGSDGSGLDHLIILDGSTK